MRFKKIRKTNTQESNIAVDLGEGWKIIESKELDLLSYLSKSESEITSEYNLVDYESVDYETLLPFRATAYRDFMLYEQHAINAARGFVKRYISGLMPVVKIYERITHKPFPKLKPSARYYKYPIYYLGNHLNIMGDNQNLSIPSYTKELDYELEIAAVIIKPIKNAKVEEVNDAIGGFVILNDFSARDVQLDEINAGFGPMKSKNFGSSISSVVIGRDELLDYMDDLQVKVYINDQLIVQSTTANKLYSLQAAIAYASWEEQLHPGEVFATGTVPGCCGIENGRMLRVGDKITLEVEKMGTLTNNII